MKKIICILLCVIVVGVLVLVGVKIYKESEIPEDPNGKYREEGWASGEYEAYLVREKIPTDIIWYGEWPGCDFEVPVRFETEVTDEILKIRDGYQKVYVVVNDLDGNVGLTDEDYKLITNFINSDSRYNFTYLGKNRLDYLSELEGYGSEHINADELSIGFFRVDDALYAHHGSYTESEVGMNICELIFDDFDIYFVNE
ncbi:MAG: hypothetical protein ACI39R_01245 [Lachnospiraceae bacterium]